MMRRLGVFVILLAWFSGSAAADNVKDYESALAAADTDWQKKDYAAARLNYEKAFAIHADPTLLFNIASTHRREGNEGKAIAAYKKFLAVAPKDHPRRELAEKTVAELQPVNQTATREPQRKRLVPEISRAAGVESNILSEEPRSGGLRPLQIGAIVSGSVGLLSLGYGLFQAKRASDRNSEFEKMPPGSEWTEERQARFNEGKRYETRARIFSVIGGAALVTGGALYYFDRRQDLERRTAVIPVAGPRGEFGIALTGSM